MVTLQFALVSVLGCSTLPQLWAAPADGQDNSIVFNKDLLTQQKVAVSTPGHQTSRRVSSVDTEEVTEQATPKASGNPRAINQAVKAVKSVKPVKPVKLAKLTEPVKLNANEPKLAKTEFKTKSKPVAITVDLPPSTGVGGKKRGGSALEKKKTAVAAATTAPLASTYTNGLAIATWGWSAYWWWTLWLWCAAWWQRHPPRTINLAGVPGMLAKGQAKILGVPMERVSIAENQKLYDTGVK